MQVHAKTALKDTIAPPPVMRLWPAQQEPILRQPMLFQAQLVRLALQELIVRLEVSKNLNAEPGPIPLQQEL